MSDEINEMDTNSPLIEQHRAARFERKSRADKLSSYKPKTSAPATFTNNEIKKANLDGLDHNLINKLEKLAIKKEAQEFTANEKNLLAKHEINFSKGDGTLNIQELRSIQLYFIHKAPK